MDKRITDSLPVNRGGTVETEMVPDERIRVGDVVRVLGWKRVVQIVPYHGTLKGCIGLVTTVPGPGFSLWESMETERVAARVAFPTEVEATASMRTATQLRPKHSCDTRK